MIVVIFACRKDFSIDNEAHQPTYLTEAKDFYYKQSKILGISAVSKQKSTSNGKSIAAIGTGKIRSITPLWYKSYLSKAGDNEFTEVPIASDEKMISVYNFAKKPQDEKINLIRANSSFKRLLIYRTKKQNFHQLQLTYVPDYDYLERNHFDASKTQINKLGDFSGYIEYSSVKDEKPIFILRFEKGKFISKYYFGKKNVKIGKGTLKVGGIEIGVKGWGEVCTPKYGQVCVLAGDPEVEHCGPMMVVGEDCEMVYTPDPDPEPDPDPVIDCDDPQYFWLCDLENPDPGEGEEPQNGSQFEVDDLDSATLVDDGKQKIDNIQKWIDCFGDGKVANTYTITIYIDQPVANKNDQYLIIPPTFIAAGQVVKVGSTDMDVGHAFVGFEKNNTDGTNVRQTLGFYPGQAGGTNLKGAIKDDGGHAYDVSYKITVSAIQFNNALNTISSDFSNGEYKLLSNNCTDAALGWINSAGGNLSGSARGIFQNTPGDFGQELRKKSTANKNGGTAPNSKGKCN